MTYNEKIFENRKKIGYLPESFPLLAEGSNGRSFHELE